MTNNCWSKANTAPAFAFASTSVIASASAATNNLENNKEYNISIKYKFKI